MTRGVTRPQMIERGHFLGTVSRLCRSICGFTKDDELEVRFVTPGGKEWRHAGTYVADGVVYIDLEPIVYKEKAPCQQS